MQTDEGLEARFDQTAFGGQPVDGIGTVADQHPHADRAGRFHAQRHGPDEGVIARSHVLQVDHQRIEILKLFPARRQAVEGRAVQAMHRHPEPGIERHILDIFHVLRLASGAVLRTENGDDSSAGRLQQIKRVAQFGIDAGGMAHHSDSGVADFSGNSLSSVSKPV